MKETLIAMLVGFLISLVVAPIVIYFAKKLKSEQKILEYVETHKEKNGTLTLGGLIFIIGASISFFIFWNDSTILSIIALCVGISFGLLGFLDDFIKIRLKRNLGLSAYQKIIGQVGISLIIAIFVYKTNLVGSEVLIPFTNLKLDLGWGIIPFVSLFYIAVTNAVNLTDGLDGLAGSLCFIFFISFIFIVNIIMKNLQNLGASGIVLDEYSGLMVLSGVLAGSVLAFLCFNFFPAKIFMGDTGSLALGGFVSSLLCFTKEYLLIFICGFVFFFTILSSALQVLFYKLTKKRIFKMAPFHHHLELSGLKETKIVFLYCALTIVLNLLSIILFLGVK